LKDTRADQIRGIGQALRAPESLDKKEVALFTRLMERKDTIKEVENTKQEVKDTKKKEFRILAKAFKKKARTDRLVLLEPYRKDIYKLRFEKQASLGDIASLFKQIGIKVSKEMIGRLCKQSIEAKTK
jgi:hypothetical protein